MAMSLNISALELAPPRHPDALTDLVPVLDQLIAAFGIRPLARLLDVTPATVSNWAARRRAISREMASRILDLHAVFARALQTFHPRTAVHWLVGSEPLLGGARPIDVLAARGAAPLLEALAGIDAGAYA